MPLERETAGQPGQREFYAGKAKDSLLLEDVIAGETTLTEHLDGLMLMRGIPNPTKRFKEYLDLLAGLGAGGLDAGELENRYNALYIEEEGVAKMALKFVGENLSIYAIIIGVVLCAVPPFTVAEPLVIAGGGAGLAAIRRSKRYYRDTRKRKEEIFGPLRKTAERLDREIGWCFLLDHFRGSRERFEETYAALPAEERDAADRMLYGFLGAGGIPGMDEQGLKKYLGGLLRPEGDG